MTLLISKVLRDELDSMLALMNGVSDAMEELWPVNSIFCSISSTNPSVTLGFGTWVSFGAGRMMIGYSASDSDFDTAEETGGAKTVTLTSAEMPSHTHAQDAHTHTQDAHAHTQQSRSAGLIGTAGSSGSVAANNQSVGTTNSTTATNQNTTATNQNTGGGGAHNNMPPFIVVYMWKRTA